MQFKLVILDSSFCFKNRTPYGLVLLQNVESCLILCKIYFFGKPAKSYDLLLNHLQCPKINVLLRHNFRAVKEALVLGHEPRQLGFHFIRFLSLPRHVCPKTNVHFYLQNMTCVLGHPVIRADIYFHGFYESADFIRRFSHACLGFKIRGFNPWIKSVD